MAALARRPSLYSSGVLDKQNEQEYKLRQNKIKKSDAHPCGIRLMGNIRSFFPVIDDKKLANLHFVLSSLQELKPNKEL